MSTLTFIIINGEFKNLVGTLVDSGFRLYKGSRLYGYILDIESHGEAFVPAVYVKEIQSTI